MVVETKKSPGRPKTKSVVKEPERKEFAGVHTIIRSFLDGQPLSTGFQDSNLKHPSEVDSYISEYLKDGWRIEFLQIVPNKTVGVSDMQVVLVKD